MIPYCIALQMDSFRNVRTHAFISIKASQEAYVFIFVMLQVKILEKFWCEL